MFVDENKNKNKNSNKVSSASSLCSNLPHNNNMHSNQSNNKSNNANNLKGASRVTSLASSFCSNLPHRLPLHHPRCCPWKVSLHFKVSSHQLIYAQFPWFWQQFYSTINMISVQFNEILWMFFKIFFIQTDQINLWNCLPIEMVK